MTAALLHQATPDNTRAYWRGVAEIPAGWGRSVVTLGVFDGLHRGHAQLLERAVELGRRRGLPVVLTTFDPHPATVAGPPRDTTPVALLDRRAELARDYGADAVLVLRFDRDLARTPADRFAVDVLVQALGATDVVVGENFRFGHRGAGSLELLEHLGHQHDFTAHGVRLLPGCSSTQVRELVVAGDLGAAAAVLGRPHRVTGHVRHGHVDVGYALLPPPGRYRVRIGTTDALAEIHERTIKLCALVPNGAIDIDFPPSVVDDALQACALTGQAAGIAAAEAVSSGVPLPPEGL
jgi:riboflavin kinase/FMN adenylyltransferase